MKEDVCYIYRVTAISWPTISKKIFTLAFVITVLYCRKNIQLSKVCLTLSRWLALKTKKDDIDSKVRKGFKGQLMTEELIHLGGGVYLTLNQKYPTVNVGHLLDAGRCR